MPEVLIECVPNFSEGRDPAIIRRITDEIERVEGVSLLDVDPGKATNRTVVTFAGGPEPVAEAAFRATLKAAELIDMSRHSGEHPRFGATDVLPFVPVSGAAMDDCVRLAHRTAERIGREIGIPVYCYEHAATRPERRNLAYVRQGEYEGLAARLATDDGKPDFGPAKFVPRTGAIAVGARDFLVAYNVNLNSTSTRRANAIAFDIREKGREKRSGDPLTGPIIKDEHGQAVWIPGSLKCVKAIGWFIEEYGVAQISINLTNLGVTPIHVAFEECCRKAADRGIRVTGSELVGMAPLSALLDAGRHFLRKQQRSLGVSDRELLKIAVKSLGLDDLRPFNPEEKVIEYAIAARRPRARRLVDMTVRGFVEETASESPAPGGGSIAAALGAFGAALATMVANLSSHKRGWDERWEEFSDLAERGKQHHAELTRLIDEDTDAFNGLMAAYGLPKGGPQQQAARTAAIQDAVRGAIEAPLRVMQSAWASMDVIAAVAERGLPASASDAGVAALCARSSVMGAGLNVRINCGSLADRSAAEEYAGEAERLERDAAAREQSILEVVRGKMR